MTLHSAFEVGATGRTVCTYEATLRNIAPKATFKLGSPVLPMVTEVQFYAFLGAVLMLGPKLASPVSAQQRVRWNYVKLVKATVAFLARGPR